MSRIGSANPIVINIDICSDSRLHTHIDGAGIATSSEEQHELVIIALSGQVSDLFATHCPGAHLIIVLSTLVDYGD